MKARVILLESAENQKKETDKKCEQMAHRLREMEKKLESNRKEINHYQVLRNAPVQLSNFDPRYGVIFL